MNKISIITVNLNDAAGLEETIRSVIAQSYVLKEFIIIDGASTDGSGMVMEKYNEHFSYSISEQDRGIYDAMNKGIARASGDHLLFLNSGDTLVNEQSLADLINSGNDADLIYGDLLMYNKNTERTVVFPDKLTFKFFYINSLPHAATLIKRSLFDTVGLYDTSLSIVSDWLFFMLAVNEYKCSYKHVGKVISKFKLGGSSSQHERVIEERQVVLKKYYPTFIDDYKQLFELSEELTETKKQLGYRVHKQIQKLL